MRRKRVNTNSIKFDGTDDHISIPNSVTRFSFSNGVDQDQPFSLSAWIYLEVDPVANSTGGAIISKSDFDESFEGRGIGTEWFFRHNNGEVQLFLYDSPPQTGEYLRIRANAATLVANKWIFIAATYDGSSTTAGLNLYQFDSTNHGLIAATADKHANYARMSNTNSKVFIGSAEEIEDGNAVAARTFEGRLADICVFDKELSLAEVSEIYNGGKVKDMTKFSAYQNIVSWWKMGDDRDHADAGGVIDYVNGFNGTLTNGAHIRYEPGLETEFITLTDNHIYTSFGRTLTPKGLNRDGIRLSQVIWAEYNDVVKGSNVDRQIPSSTYYVDGNIYKTINGVDTLISYNTENQRYLHITADLTNYSRTNVLVVPWYWYYGNQVFVRFAGLGNPLLAPGISNVASINYTNDLQLLAAPKEQVSSKVLELYGADKVFFQVFTSEGISLNSGGGSESDDILIFAGVNTF